MGNLEMIKDEPFYTKSGSDNIEDVFNHEVFAETLLNIIKENDPPLTIGLFGKWGIGKTSIITLLSEKLRNEKQKYFYSYFNAWKYSGDSFRRQFLINLATSEGICNGEKKQKKAIKRLQELNHISLLLGQKETLRIAKKGMLTQVPTLLLFIGVIVTLWYFPDKFGLKWTNITMIGISLLSFILVIFNFLRTIGEGLFRVEIENIYDHKLVYPEQFEKEFKELIKSAETNFSYQKFIIVIDDLDRCEPETIKEVMVTMKNFLGIDKCIFIVPIDDEAILKIYRKNEEGADNFGYEQLRKYFNVTIRIPEPYHEDISAFAEKIAEKNKINIYAALIAAMGNCNDARKMKHFLNLYKIQLEIANNRITKGDLKGVKILDLELVLAKMVVLEYQWKDFYKYLLENNEKADEIIKELTNKPKQTDGKENETEDFRKQKDLVKFLQNSNSIPMIEFELLSKLKQTNYEKDLTLKNFDFNTIILSDDIQKYEEHLSKINFNESFSPIRELIKNNLNKQSKYLFEGSYNFLVFLLKHKSNEIGEDKKNILFDILKLFTINSNSEVKIDNVFGNVDVFLNNFSELNDKEKDTVSEKLLKDSFSKEENISEIHNIFNHEKFPVLLQTNIINKKIINDSLDEWTKNAHKEKLEIFMISINKIKLSKSERNDLDLCLLCPEIIKILLDSIEFTLDRSKEEYNNLVLETIFSLNNRCDYKSFGDNLIKIISFYMEKNIQDPQYNEILKSTFVTIKKYYFSISNNEAKDIGRIMINYSRIQNNEDARVNILMILLICVIQNDPNDTNIQNHYETKIKQCDKYILFEHLKDIFEMDDEFKNKGKIYIENTIKESWKVIIGYFRENKIIFSNVAELCTYKDSPINKNQIYDFTIRLLNINEKIDLSLWKDFITKKFNLLLKTNQKDIIKKLSDNINSQDLSVDFLNNCKKIGFEIIEKYYEENKENFYNELIESLINSEEQYSGKLKKMFREKRIKIPSVLKIKKEKNDN